MLADRRRLLSRMLSDRPGVIVDFEAPASGADALVAGTSTLAVPNVPGVPEFTGGAGK